MTSYDKSFIWYSYVTLKKNYYVALRTYEIKNPDELFSVICFWLLCINKILFL